MRFIKKNQQPQSLIEAKKTIPLPKYDDLDKHVKMDIRISLLEEQGHICCYCMQRIEIDKMKIEHYQSQSDFPKLQLEFKNMLAACEGEIITEKGIILHCDSAKGKKSLDFLNPNSKAKKHILQNLKYISSGEIISTDEEVQKEVEEILNLNQEQLKLMRKGVIDALVEMIKKEFKKGEIKKSFFLNKIEEYKTLREGKLAHFCQVRIYYLEKKLKQLPKQKNSLL